MSQKKNNLAQIYQDFFDQVQILKRRFRDKISDVVKKRDRAKVENIKSKIKNS